MLLAEMTTRALARVLGCVARGEEFTPLAGWEQAQHFRGLTRPQLCQTHTCPEERELSAPLKIRPYQCDDEDAVMALWRAASQRAHPFMSHEGEGRALRFRRPERAR